jgi:hypothetical protein
MVDYTKPHIYRRQIITTGKYYIGKHKGVKPVLQYDKQGNFIKEWNSITEAEFKLNLCKGRISSCCRYINKTAGGFIWRFKNNPITDKNFKLSTHKSSIPILQHDLQGNFIKEWDSISIAIKQTKIKGILNNVSGRAKTAGRYIFSYKKI